MKITIEVTAEDIRRAVDLAEERDAGDGPPVGESCPIALAAMRALHSDRVETIATFVPMGERSGWTLEVGECRSNRKVFDLPEAAVEFIERFDDARMVQPFSFEVEG